MLKGDHRGPGSAAAATGLRPVPPLLAALALLAGLAPPLAVGGERPGRDAGAAAGEELTVGSDRFRIVYPPQEEAAARRIRRAVEAAASRVARWGGLAHPVTITLHPTRAALEVATRRPGHGLRAWARRESVDIQSPRTWEPPGASDRELEELVAHELTHCAMYQRAGDAVSWMHRGIPRWFAEGIASVTAGEGHRHAPAEELFLGTEDPLADPDPAGPPPPDSVYAASHHAVEHLLSRHGEARVAEVLALMGRGLRFPAAFRQAIGIPDSEFVAQFRREVERRRRAARADGARAVRGGRGPGPAVRRGAPRSR